MRKTHIADADLSAVARIKNTRKVTKVDAAKKENQAIL